MKMLVYLNRGWIWIRTYLVALALLFAFGSAMVEVYGAGVGPMPQQPPDGYTVQRTRAALQWSRGSTKEDLKLQISIDTPDFDSLVVDKKVSGKTYSMKNLDRGHTYYWRIIGENVKSPVAKFKASKYAIDL